MKAIIIAAGMGKRLMPYTKNRPKCMLEIGGKPLIKHQADILISLGIKEIHVVKGYKQEAFDIFENDVGGKYSTDGKPLRYCPVFHRVLGYSAFF